MDQFVIDFALILLKNNSHLLFFLIGVISCLVLISKIYSWFKNNVPSKNDLNRLVDKIDFAINSTNKTIEKNDESIKDLNKAIYELSSSINELAKKQAFIEGSLNVR